LHLPIFIGNPICQSAGTPLYALSDQRPFTIITPVLDSSDAGYLPLKNAGFHGAHSELP
jgi:hypothetical protein